MNLASKQRRVYRWPECTIAWWRFHVRMLFLINIYLFKYDYVKQEEESGTRKASFPRKVGPQALPSGF
jgi:hypothetical protein